MSPWEIALAAALLAALAAGAWSWFGPRPSAHRDWTLEHRVAPEFVVDGDRLSVRGVRNFRWRSATEHDAAWEDRTYDLRELRRVWYILTPFSTAWRGPAHSLLSFQFGEDRFLALSVEARREVGETYGIVKGMFKRFEILYVAGDERDLVALRAVHRSDSVFVYPARASVEGVRALLLDMADEANRLRTEPAFYHTIRDNCTTRLVDHVNRVAPLPIRWGWQILLPGYSDALALRRGLLDTDLSLADARKRWYVNDRARRWADAEDFSVRIRMAEDGRAPDVAPGSGPAGAG